MMPEHGGGENPGEEDQCPKKPKFIDYGDDTEQRLLHRNGVIDSIPTNICNAETGKTQKNVILVVGDGMGWEMIRAGAIARQVIDELEAEGCDTKVGCPDMDLLGKFSGRSLSDYYTEGKLHIHKNVSSPLHDSTSTKSTSILTHWHLFAFSFLMSLFCRQGIWTVLSRTSRVWSSHHRCPCPSIRDRRKPLRSWNFAS